MKFLSVVAKNLKLLFRSRETLFTIIFGPLLIILLVSAAYTGGDTDTALRIGTYAPQYTPLADQMITAMKGKGYLVSVFDDQQQCIDRIKSAELHTCVIFPPDFRFKGNGTNTVTFAVDYSRVNLVYRIIDGLSEQFGLQSTELSQGVASDLLARVQLAHGTVQEQLAAADAIDKGLVTARAKLAGGKASIESVDVNISYVDLLEIRGRVNGLGITITELKREGQEALANASELLGRVEDRCANCSSETQDLLLDGRRALQNASDRLSQVADAGPQAVAAATMVVEDAARSMAALRSSFDGLVNASQEVDADLQETIALLDEADARVTTLRGNLRHLDESLQQSVGLNASSVATPITTRIEAISGGGNLAFTYPYVLMLVIMFLGLMLNSTLIVMDKTSKAAFRNFTTATRDEYHVLMSFITTFLILLAQTLAILLVSYFFLSAPLFANFGTSLLIIVVAITLFSFLGMIIGYLAGTQEAAMIASLSLGSVLLFISNLVLPLEAMNRVVQALSVHNPYVVLSELLKQSMLFGLPLGGLLERIGVLVLGILLLFVLILAVQRSFKRRYFQRRSKDLGTGAFAPKRKVKPLLVKDREIRDLFDLLEALDAMTRAEFEQAVSPERNPIAEWVRNEIGERSLGRRMDTRSKERMILALDKHLKRRTKKLAKAR